MDKIVGIIILYVIIVNLAGVVWGWSRNDFETGWIISVVGGTGVGISILGIGFAIWILIGAPV